MKKIILIIFMAMISSFSYYGAVNEKGEKVVSFETTPQEENIIMNQTTEEIQENVIEQVENIVVQVEEIQQEEIEQPDTTNENSIIPVAKSKDKNNGNKNTTQQTQTKQDTQVSEQQETKANTNATEKKEEMNTNTNQDQNTNTTNNAPKCTHSSDGWYNSETEAKAIYNAEIKKWGDKWTNYEIDNDTYYKNCPSGYEVFSCPYCNKWTINLFY